MKIEKLMGIGKHYPKHDVASFFMDLARVGITDEADKVICLVRGYSDVLVGGNSICTNDESMTPLMALDSIIAAETDIALASLKYMVSLILFSAGICR